MNLICGINPVLEALNAGQRHFDRLLIVKGIRNRRVSEAISRASQNGIPLRFEARETLDRMAGGVPHQGLIAVVSAKPALALEALLDQARNPALVVVLDGVEDPRNLGAILRTAEAAGADGVLLPERHSAGLSETVSRASAGGLEHVAVARIGNVAQALDALKGRGFWVVGFDATGSERWDAVDFRRPVALVLGGEGRGIRRLVRERCDHLASLPLFGHVGSLNVSVVAGIALYEAIRQRGAVPSHVRPIPVKAQTMAKRIVGPGPDDQEADPGAMPRAAAEDEREDDSAEGAPAGPVSVSLVHMHDEEAAWSPRTTMGPGPRIQRSAPTHGGSPRPGSHPRAAADGPPPSAAAPTEDRPASRDGRGASRRRRRQGRRPGSSPPVPSHAAVSTSEPAGPAVTAPAAVGDAAGGPPGGPQGQGHRRRRRRRRR